VRYGPLYQVSVHSSVFLYNIYLTVFWTCQCFSNVFSQKWFFACLYRTLFSRTA
jgi:hypothetical protein